MTRKSQIIILIFSLVWLCLYDVAQCEVDENTMKVVAFEQISRFIKWPQNNPDADGSGKFVIGTMGENAVVALTQKLYGKYKIKNKAVEVKSISGLEDVAGCNLIYIAESKKDDIPDLIAITRSRPILTITDTPGYTEAGILVTLRMKSNKLMFEINEQGFHESGLEIDPLLLRVSKIVNPLGGKQ